MFSLLLALIYMAFISLGVPDGLLGSAWPVMHTEMAVPESYMGIVSMIISGGTIISMSMCHSVFKMSDGTIQLGVRPRTRGLLLPGYRVETPEDGTNAVISGPSLRTEYTLPSHIYLDESGFLAELS